MGELHALFVGVHNLAELTARSEDAISGMGERLSFAIVAEAMTTAGVRARGVDSRELIVTDESFGRAAPLQPRTNDRLRAALLPLIEAGTVPVLPGFIAATERGVSSTLGRGGSDW